MTIKYTNIFNSKALQNLPKFGWFDLKTNNLATLLTAVIFEYLLFEGPGQASSAFFGYPKQHNVN
jgi:hypothetical protein